MSYSIYIGNAELETDWPGADYGGPHAEWVVHGTTHDDAPYKPDMTGKGNSCHPGYSQWSDAMDTVGLAGLWFAEETGLLCEHPGIKALKAEHLAEMERARDHYRACHPNERAGMCKCKECNRLEGKADVTHDPTLNFNMLRLEWMIFWTRWALANCGRPAVYNR